MADPIQSRAKDKRLADALRANLKRRKAAVRERDAAAEDDISEAPPSGPRPAKKD